MATRAHDYLQPSLFEEDDICSKSSSTFVDNMSLPVHRWFRYSAGFSGAWVKEEIRAAKSTSVVRVLDPFAGSGTVLVEAENADVPAIGVESHPFVGKVAKAKIRHISDPDSFRKFGLHILKRAEKVKPCLDGYSPLIRKCYTDELLAELDQLRQSVLSGSDEQFESVASLHGN
jgi:hypothetical protein